MIEPVSSPSILESSLQGMNKTQAQLGTTAARLARLPAAPEPGQVSDTVDLSTEMISLLNSRDNFMANVEAAKTGDQLQRSLLNILG
jgi:hypothetical protein